MKKGLIKYSENRGFGVPFVLIFVGILGVLKTPQFDELEVHQGDIIPSPLVIIKLLGNENIFNIQTKDQKTVLPILYEAKHARIWIKDDNSDKKYILQLELDGELIVEYKYFRELLFELIMLIIGLILVPFVIKGKIKQRRRDKSYV